jgi:uncharacterized small protein (DUF1192 family)
MFVELQSQVESLQLEVKRLKGELWHKQVT